MQKLNVHIAHLSSVHQRYDQRVFRKECRGLARLGYKVSLLVADGKSDEVMDGVSISSVPRPHGRLERVSTTMVRIYNSAKALNADVYQVHDPELLIVAMFLKASGRQVVFDMHEDAVVQMRIKPYLNGFQRFLYSALYALLERGALRRIAGLAAATDGLVLKYGRYARRSVSIANYVDTSIFPERELSFERAVIFHPGALGKVRGLENMISLAKILPTGSELILAGRLDKNYSARDLAPARYLGLLEEREIQEIYATANIGIILYNPVGQYGGATAVKAYEYMAASMPIIMPDHGEWPDFNRKVNCGINVRVDDPRAVLAAVERLLKDPVEAARMGRNGRAYVLQNCAWETELSKLAGLYESIVEEVRGGRRDVQR